MENIYDRIEKAKVSFMKIMPKINSRLTSSSKENPLLNFTISELKVLQLFKEQSKYKMSELANVCGIPLPTATHVVDKLVKNKFVKRVSDENDRRVIFIKATVAGKKTMEECDLYHKESVKQMMSMLVKEDQEKLVKAIEHFAKVVDDISGKMEKKPKTKEGGK
ncbi:MAG: MarR family transcriptional regulator [Candidatus Firestonebacteria bacterium]|nr:MarR family transcriptional regulator [Candidatus Firestonebacteria bacterium]